MVFNSPSSSEGESLFETPPNSLISDFTGWDLIALSSDHVDQLEQVSNQETNVD